MQYVHEIAGSQLGRKKSESGKRELLSLRYGRCCLSTVKSVLHLNLRLRQFWEELMHQRLNQCPRSRINSNRPSQAVGRHAPTIPDLVPLRVPAPRTIVQWRRDVHTTWHARTRGTEGHVQCQSTLHATRKSGLAVPTGQVNQPKRKGRVMRGCCCCAGAKSIIGATCHKRRKTC